MKRRVNLGSNSQRADYGVSSAVYPILKNISEFLTEIPLGEQTQPNLVRDGEGLLREHKPNLGGTANNAIRPINYVDEGLFYLE